MSQKITDKDIFTKRVADMTEEERLRAIERLELLRDEVTIQMESIMEEVSAETGAAKHKKRRFKVGDAPNDR